MTQKSLRNSDSKIHRELYLTFIFNPSIHPCYLKLTFHSSRTQPVKAATYSWQLSALPEFHEFFELPVFGTNSQHEQ